MQAQWSAIDADAGIYRARYQVTGTTPYSTALRISDNQMLIYSPGPGLEMSLSEIAEPDTELLLLAPCLGHNLGLQAWQQAHPKAQIFAPDGIQQRIRDKRGIEVIRSLDELRKLLPDTVSVHELPENGFHEAWLSIDVGNKTYWTIGDAFLNFETVEANFIMKFLLGIYGIKPGLRMHKLFRMGLKDKPGFKAWVVPLFDNDRQHILLPCHREVYAAADCGERMVEIVQAAC